PLIDPDGKVYAVGGIATDITDRIRVLEALRKNERLLADFFERSPMAVLWVAADGQIERVNRAWLDLTGFGREDCLGHSVEALQADDDSISELLELIKKQPVVNNHRAQVRRKDGAVRHVLVDADGFWADGELVHSRWFVRDITRRMELER